LDKLIKKLELPHTTVHDFSKIHVNIINLIAQKGDLKITILM